MSLWDYADEDGFILEILETQNETTNQLALAIEPKEGSVKAAVLDFLRGRPDGSCRRDFAAIDIYEVASRIGELKKDGWHILTRPCKRHNHRRDSHFVEYYLG